MGKLLNIYRGYTVSEMRNRASIPTQTNIVETTNAIDCSNISMNAVKGVLGASSYSLAALCTHANINQWSGFSPKVLSYSNQGLTTSQLVISNPTIYRLGDFAGYNHSASTPGWTAGGQVGASADIWVDFNGSATFISDVNIGELRYPGAQGVALTVCDSGGGIVAWGVNDLTHERAIVGLSATINNVQSQATYTLKSYIINNPTTFAEQYILCRIPNVGDVTCTVKVKSATSIEFIGSNWRREGSADLGPVVGYNATTGECWFGNMYNPNSIVHLKIVARLYNWLDGQVGSDVIMYHDAYTGYATINSTTAQMSMTNIPAYGYKFQITCEELPFVD